MGERLVAKVSTINFRPIADFGGDPRRQINQLEANVKETFMQVDRALQALARLMQLPISFAEVNADMQLEAVTRRLYLVETSSPHSLVLPPHAEDLVIGIADVTGSAGSNNITVKPNEAGTKIHGNASDYVIDVDGATRWFQSTKSQWWVTHA